MPPTRIGLISDTHGHIVGQVWRLFADVDRILHAGDIGGYHLIRELETVAPVEAVRRNTDGASHRVPEVLTTSVGGITVQIRHKLETTSPMLHYLAATRGADLVLFGHTHQPFVEQVRGALFVNPGSASRGRGGMNTAGILTVEDQRLSVTIHGLDADLSVVSMWPVVEA